MIVLGQLKAVIPITVAREWRSIIDVIAVGAYLSGVFPLLGLALMDSILIMRHKAEKKKLKIHAIFVSIFLVVAHVAMVFGRVDPAVLSGAVHLYGM